MSKPKQMQCYHDLVKEVLDQPSYQQDRTGVGTKSVFGRTLRFDLTQGFPLLTTKKVHWKSVAAELLWFLDGESNTKSLQERGCTIWDEWCDADGNIGPIYGKQWRKWRQFDLCGGYGPLDGHFDLPGGARELVPVDQIFQLLESLRTEGSRHSRRHVVSAWNVAELHLMKLPPCHYSFQCHVDRNDRLSILVNQRSADLFLGVPFNIASYAALVHLLCAAVNKWNPHCLPELTPGELILNLGDAHVYNNHEKQCITMLGRSHYAPPTLKIDASKLTKHLYDVPNDVFILENYECHPTIKAPVAV